MPSARATLTTRPLLPAGGTLTVNADVAALTAEVLDARTGAVIRGYEAVRSSAVTGDTLGAAITWDGRDLAALRGRPIKLRFHLRGGDLYAFRIT